MTCWNNRTVRVVSAAAKTVHKHFVGGEHNLQQGNDYKTAMHLLLHDCIATLEWQDTSWVMIQVLTGPANAGISWGKHCTSFIQQHFHCNILDFVHPGYNCKTFSVSTIRYLFITYFCPMNELLKLILTGTIAPYYWEFSALLVLFVSGIELSPMDYLHKARSHV